MIITPPFSLITFDGTGEPVPYIDASDIAFQVVSDTQITSISMFDMDNNLLQETSEVILESDIDAGVIYYVRPFFSNAVPDCFVIKLMNGDNVLAESNTFVKTIEKKYTSRIDYRCEEDSFGFVYCPGYISNSIRMPFHLKDPQYPQEQKEYRTRNGRLRVTSASINEVYPLETDYMSKEMHKKLLIALSHDFVQVNGVLLTKSESYDVDWDNALEQNGIRMAKATCTMSGNVTHRNSNCGSRCALDFDVQPRTLYVTAL
jgi:hypothetical protein